MERAEKEDIPTTRWTLEKEHEFRFEVDFGTTATIQLVHGTAECFGTELALDRKYKYTGTKGAIFTWHGCTLEVTNNARAYVANETPMLSYANLHALIEERRVFAQASGEEGPRVVLVGPIDSGKTSLSRILLGYAARRGRQPTYVDLDIGQGSITIPGAIAAAPIDRPIDVEEGFATCVPVAYFYGHTTLDANPHLYRLHMRLLADAINKRFEKNPDSTSSGLIVNTCGWVDGLGYQLLLDALDILKADYVAVIDHERLYNDLMQVFQNKKNIHILKLAKSGGVVTRDTPFRRKCRMNRVREYFYGITGDLCPHSTVVDFKDVCIYRIGGGPAAPQSALPIGAQPTVDPVQLVEIIPNSELAHSILAVVHADNLDAILKRNIAGFLYVTDVNFEKRKITVLAPCPGPLPSKYLLLGTLKWLE
jgi:polyribonucleotide 5'-hydroxyl-kinase